MPLGSHATAYIRHRQIGLSINAAEAAVNAEDAASVANTEMAIAEPPTEAPAPDSDLEQYAVRLVAAVYAQEGAVGLDPAAYVRQCLGEGSNLHGLCEAFEAELTRKPTYSSTKSLSTSRRSNRLSSSRPRPSNGWQLISGGTATTFATLSPKASAGRTSSICKFNCCRRYRLRR